VPVGPSGARAAASAASSGNSGLASSANQRQRRAESSSTAGGVDTGETSQPTAKRARFGEGGGRGSARRGNRPGGHAQERVFDCSQQVRGRIWARKSAAGCLEGG